MSQRPPQRARLVIAQEDIDRGGILSWLLEVRFMTRNMDDMVRIVKAIQTAVDEELAREPE